MERGRDALVVCVGNELVADDAAGWAVYQRLAAGALPPGVHAIFLACGGMALIEALGGEDLLVIVDAVELGFPAGTVHTIAAEELPRSGGAVSAHGIGIPEVLEVGRLLCPERMPRRTVLIGIEGRCFDRPGREMTAAVEAAVPVAVHRVVRTLWEHGARYEFSHDYAVG